MISFRPFIESDITQIIAWLRQPHVLDVWDSAQGVEDEIIRKKYQQRLNDTNIQTYIIQYNLIDIGLIQTYVIENNDDFGLYEKAMAFDLFIGDPDYIDRGIGTLLMKQFVSEYVFVHDDVNVVCIDPEVANERAIKAYRNIGFEYYNVGFDNHSDLLTCYLTMTRKQFEEANKKA